MADDPEPDVDELEPDPETEPEPEVEPEAEPEADAEPEAEPEIAEPGGEPGEVRTQERQPSRAERRISGQQEALRARDQQIADLNKRLDRIIAGEPPVPSAK